MENIINFRRDSVNGGMDGVASGTFASQWHDDRRFEVNRNDFLGKNCLVCKQFGYVSNCGPRSEVPMFYGMKQMESRPLQSVNTDRCLRFPAGSAVFLMTLKSNYVTN